MIDPTQAPVFVQHKPTVIATYRYDGHNGEAIARWMRALDGEARWDSVDRELVIKTPDGWHDVAVGGYVMYGTQREFYEISSAVFDACYQYVTGPIVVEEGGQ